MSIVSLILALVQLALKFADWAEARKMFNEHQRQFLAELYQQNLKALEEYRKFDSDFRDSFDPSGLRKPDEHTRE